MDSVEIHKDPYGVVLVIGPWNYPIQLTLLPLAGAIAAGNCVIMKPSEVAPASAKFIAETIPKYIDNVSIFWSEENTKFYLMILLFLPSGLLPSDLRWRRRNNGAIEIQIRLHILHWIDPRWTNRSCSCK